MKKYFFILLLSCNLYAQKDAIEQCIAPRMMQMAEYDAESEVVSPMIYDGRAHPCAWLACICCWGVIGGAAGGAIGIWNTPGIALLHTMPLPTMLAVTHNAINGCKIGCASCTPAALILASPSVARKTNEMCRWLFIKGNE